MGWAALLLVRPPQSMVTKLMRNVTSNIQIVIQLIGELRSILILRLDITITIFII